MQRLVLVQDSAELNLLLKGEKSMQIIVGYNDRGRRSWAMGAGYQLGMNYQAGYTNGIPPEGQEEGGHSNISSHCHRTQAAMWEAEWAVTQGKAGESSWNWTGRPEMGEQRCMSQAASASWGIQSAAYSTGWDLRHPKWKMLFGLNWEDSHSNTISLMTPRCIFWSLHRHLFPLPLLISREMLKASLSLVCLVVIYYCLGSDIIIRGFAWLLPEGFTSLLLHFCEHNAQWGVSTKSREVTASLNDTEETETGDARPPNAGAPTHAHWRRNQRLTPPFKILPEEVGTLKVGQQRT